ncbi:hypothetical protein Riv7116_4046 [Rivularia sp. PCC 7116]|uniref:hypothetical protein n=1 Tax=Rivularia sp. PCC 7116 TaxID=373994 RepID=UPI00029F3C34|nr:hypothetical protein [Rivularia sp. PCC 7116]AFY56486.1 hypothetical protein Riv7116_4046 [Rivularia sp. PCC 7116]
MKRQILGSTIAVSTILLTAFPGLKNAVKNIASGKIHKVKYQAVKLDNSMDAMLNPEQGGIRPMPPPPRWIPPVEEGINHQLPPARMPKKPGYGNYTPTRYLPHSTPGRNPLIKDKLQLRNKPAYPIR